MPDRTGLAEWITSDAGADELADGMIRNAIRDNCDIDKSN